MTHHLFDVCSRMKQLGFEYASMVTPKALSKLTHNPTEVDGLLKPLNCLWTSRIDLTYGDGDADEPTKFAPEWYSFVVGEGFDVEPYSKRDLLVVKFDESRLVDESDPRFKKGGVWHDPAGWMAKPKWSMPLPVPNSRSRSSGRSMAITG